MGKWASFTKERFDPVSHLAMIGLFFAAHAGFIQASAPSGAGMNVSAFGQALLALGTLAFFFKLRLYDEIKDYAVDLRHNPTRPLVRGLVTHGDLYRGIGVCIVAELLCFGGAALVALPGAVLAIGYSLLMYKEFFIGERIRPHLTTYAVLHTVVSSLLSLALLSGLSARPVWALPAEAYWFASSSWFLFNIFEFGRKTFTSGEERPLVESYSKIFGRFGAVLLVLAMALISVGLLLKSDFDRPAPMAFELFLWVSVLVLVAVGAAYALTNRAELGRVYRGFSSAYIVIIYSGVLARWAVEW